MPNQIKRILSQVDSNIKTPGKVRKIIKGIEKSVRYDEQRGCCAICHCSLASVSKAHFDHNHMTGQYRGLLCSACNTGLGFFRESILSLENAIRYLQTWRKS